MRGCTYFRRWGFSINEGSGPVNVHMSWAWPKHRLGEWFFFYLFAFGRKWSYLKCKREVHEV